MSRRTGVQLQADEGAAGVAASLADDLRHALRGPALVVGVGNPARGDDGVGPAVIGLLRSGGATMDDEAGGERSYLDVGDAPERYLGPIAESGAEVVLFVDAVDFGGEPGQVVLLREEELPARSCVTHRSSLGLVMQYLREQGGQRSLLLGVQPATVDFGEGLTPAVQRAAENVAAALAASGRAHDAADEVRRCS